MIECELQIKPKLGGTILDNNLNLLQSENSDFREVLNESSVLELQLNIDELQELHTMCLRSANRNYIAQLIAQLVAIRNKFPHHFNSTRKIGRKWSDIVAGRSSQVSKPNSTATHNIETVITSRPTQNFEEIHEMKTNNSIQPTVKKNKMTQGDVRPRIIALGDSHARGIAGELRHHSTKNSTLLDM